MGKAAAAAAYKAGASVVLVGRSESKLATAKAYVESRVPEPLPSSSISTATMDITDTSSVKDFFARYEGGFDHLVITAGPSNDNGSIEGDDGYQGLIHQMNLKLFAQLCVVSYGASKVRTGGSIVLTSGVLAQRPGKGATSLSIANAGLEAAARGLANDWGPRLRVNVLSPGLTATEMWDNMPPEQREGMLKGFGSTLPLGRSGEADDMGHGVLFLLTSEYVTGLTIQVDGGALIRP